ncbi:hypothetical protein CHS0354_030938 [Potamilus streckersoni]|uniref:2-iminobutanoate/2-iminopropanoate deaminase n=1 Tax=Potamilus streckersoni TaxID=2493646 RepID=A0AAE0RYS1_9BIVA|nr:hypothetical protein CHS0354_030938 [Potamilus streckersoni]
MAGIVRKIITSAKVPAPVAPYSPAVLVDKTMYISGQVGRDPTTGNLVPGGVVPEAHQTLKNIGTILEAAGIGYNNVVKVTVLLADIKDFASVNDVYTTYFTSNYPARAAYQVAALPLNARIEIEVVAVVGNIVDA